MPRVKETLTKKEQEIANNIEKGNFRCNYPAGKACSSCHWRKVVGTCDTCGNPICRACARLKLTNKKNDLSIHHNWCLPKKEQRHIKIGDDF